MSIDVSVIVITRNSARTIAGCIESLLRQTAAKEKTEIIIVDGSSTDDTVAICRKYPVKIVELNEFGIPYQRNTGLLHSQGELVAFLDSDDTASPDWIKTLQEHLRKHEGDNTAAVGCAHSLANRKGTFVKLAWLEHYYRHLRSNQEVHHLGTSGTMFRKSVIKALGCFDIKLLAAEDMDLSSRIIRAGFKIHLLKKRLISVEYASSLFKYLKKQQKNVAYMLMFFLKPKSVRSTRGSYSNSLEHIQGILPAIFILASIIWRLPGAAGSLAIWLIALVVLNIPFLSFLKQYGKQESLTNIWPIVVVPYLFVRSIAWFAGLVQGSYLTLKSFFVTRRSKDQAIKEGDAHPG